jgi:alcohol dehydrogenase class IV
MSGAFHFDYGPKVTCGAGASSRIAEFLPDGRVLFVTDGGIMDLGLADAALAELGDDRAVLFANVHADPSAASVEAAAELGRAAGVNSVVGFGGGSPMDVAKSAAYLLGSGDRLDDVYGIGLAQGARLPLVLVPTTAGTGSEATHISILTVYGTLKKGIVSASLYADRAVLDAQLTVGLPRSVTAATGVDAMVHAIEAYTARLGKNPLSDALAREALRLLADNIRMACNDGADIAAREAMLLGAHLAGVAFANSSCAGVHALAYPLGGHFHIPHGLSNALMLPHVLGHTMRDARSLYAELAELVDPGLAKLGEQARAQGFVEALRALCKDCGLPAQLSEVGIAASDLDLLAAEGMKQERLLVQNMTEITQADARRLYEAAL